MMYSNIGFSFHETIPLSWVYKLKCKTRTSVPGPYLSNSEDRYRLLMDKDLRRLEQRMTRTLEERMTRTLEERMTLTLDEMMTQTLEERMTQTMAEMITRAMEKRMTLTLEERMTRKLEEAGDQRLGRLVDLFTQPLLQHHPAQAEVNSKHLWNKIHQKN